MITFHAKTLRGLEQVLAQELKDIGASDIKPVNRGVDFSGSISMLYKANLCLRTAIRILMPISKFKAVNEDQLYKKIMAIDWSEYMTIKNSFAVDAVVFSDVYRNSHFVELKVKDAIVDQFRNKTSVRPSVDTKNADVRINVHVTNTYFLLSLDSSGDSLHKRGYRTNQHMAPLNEVLAAGMLLLTGWKGEVPLYNPMCGSGTLALEAAMIAANIFPGVTGRKYAFESWPDFDEVLYDRVRESLPAENTSVPEIYASDIDPDAVRLTKLNARNLGMQDYIKIEKADFLQSEQNSNPGLMVLNPPYGERLKRDDILSLYSGIGSTLKHKFPGTTAWLFTANFEALKVVGLKPDKKITLYNASLECKYLKYSVFSGSRKEFKSSN